MVDISANDLLEQARIQQVLLQYATSLDTRNWAGLDEVFTAVASVNYHGVGAFQGRPAIISVIQGHPCRA